MIIFDFLFSLCWNFWFVIWITCNQWNFVIMLKHILITKFHLVISDHAMQHFCKIERKSEKHEIYIYNCKQFRNHFTKKIIKKNKLKNTQKFHYISIIYDFFLKDFICLSLQLSLSFLFLKDFIIFIVFCQSNSCHLLS